MAILTPEKLLRLLLVLPDFGVTFDCSIKAVFSRIAFRVLRTLVET